jgi:hypothetical protein
MDTRCIAAYFIKNKQYRCNFSKTDSDYCHVHSCDKNRKNYIISNEITKSKNDVKYLDNHAMIEIESKGKLQKEENIGSYIDFNDQYLSIKIKMIESCSQFRHELKFLIGPIFDDLTLCYNQYDPIGCDQLWDIVDGRKIPCSINKFLLFSYYDFNSLLTCVSVFSLKIILQDANLSQELSTSDMNRARKLITLYNDYFDLFDFPDINDDVEKTVDRKITNIFRLFKKIDVKLDSKYLSNINNIADLVGLSNSLKIVIRNNSKDLNISNTDKFFDAKTSNIITVIDHKYYIINEIERYLTKYDTEISYWIIVKELSMYNEDLKLAYPNAC